ncbi:MAG: GNAT family N-acetyltransferase [Nocardioidaceae bacterium]|nr:GNAT family N-acetyltransferase [Nocardioidaceae bacterium]
MAVTIVGVVTDLAAPTLHSISLEEVRARDAFVRWSIPDDGHAACWAVGSSVAVVHRRAPRPMLPSPWAVLLGRPAELRPLVDALPGLIGGPPAGVTMSADAYELIPHDWAFAARGHWDYMVTSTVPAVPRGVEIEEIDDVDVINAVLDADNADAHARPGDPDVQCWLGIGEGSAMACVGALVLTHNGGGHLRAITTLRQARGRGLGSALSAALTRRGLERLSPEVTLGVYSDNVAAIRLYERLGYRLVHHFTSAARAEPRDQSDIC